MSNLETEVRALIEALEKLSEHQMDDAMFRQWRDGVYPAVERVRGALDGGGEAVGQICDDGLGAYVELHDDYSFTVGQPVYTHSSASVPEGYVAVPIKIAKRIIIDSESWLACFGEPDKGDYYAAFVDLENLLAATPQPTSSEIES